MMYFKLAYRNIRRSLRDYIIYFVTLTLTAALMYSFLALGFSPDILAMAENMSILTSWYFDFIGAGCIAVLVRRWLCHPVHAGPAQEGVRRL